MQNSGAPLAFTPRRTLSLQQLAKGALQAAMLGLSKWEALDQVLIWGI